MMISNHKLLGVGFLRFFLSRSCSGLVYYFPTKRTVCYRTNDLKFFFHFGAHVKRSVYSNFIINYDKVNEECSRPFLLFLQLLNLFTVVLLLFGSPLFCCLNECVLFEGFVKLDFCRASFI